MPNRDENLVVNTPVRSKAPHSKMIESIKFGKLIPPLFRLIHLVLPEKGRFSAYLHKPVLQYLPTLQRV